MEELECQMNEAEIVDCYLSVKSCAIHICRLAEVNRVLCSGIEIDAVDIGVSRCSSGDSIQRLFLRWCRGLECILFHESWNALEVLNIKLHSGCFALAIFFDESI